MRTAFVADFDEFISFTHAAIRNQRLAAFQAVNGVKFCDLFLDARANALKSFQEFQRVDRAQCQFGDEAGHWIEVAHDRAAFVARGFNGRHAASGKWIEHDLMRPGVGLDMFAHHVPGLA